MQAPEPDSRKGNFALSSGQSNTVKLEQHFSGMELSSDQGYRDEKHVNWRYVIRS